MSCSNGINNQEQSDYIKELESRIQKLESINAKMEDENKTPETTNTMVTSSAENFMEEPDGVGATLVEGSNMYGGDGFERNATDAEWVDEITPKKGSLSHIKQEFDDNSITQEGEFFIDSDGDAFKWNGNDYDWVQYRDQNTRRDIANVRWKRSYTLFDLTTDEPIFPVNVAGILMYKIYYTSNENPSPKYGEFTVSQLESHLYYKFKNEENCITFLNGGAEKKEEKKDVEEEKRKEGEGGYKVRSEFPLIKMVTAHKCSWCNNEFEQIEAFKHPTGTYSSSDIYKLKDDQSELNHLEYVYELIQNGDEDAASTEWYIYSFIYDQSYYCSRKCANHQ